MNNIMSFIHALSDYSFLQYALVAGILLGAIAGVIGSFSILQGTSLIGDAMSHAVLSGIAIASLLHFPYYWGAALFGLLAARVINLISRETPLKNDAAIGITFSTFFALGTIIMTLGHATTKLTDILFGNILAVQASDVVATVLVGLLVLIFVTICYHGLFLMVFDRSYAKASGVRTQLLSNILMVLLTLVIVISLQAVGVILVTALLVTPAATARLLTKRFVPMMITASGIGMFSALIGLYISYTANVPSGPAIVVTSAVMFMMAMFVYRVKKHGVMQKIMTLSVVASLVIAALVGWQLQQRHPVSAGYDGQGRLNVVSSFSIINSMVTDIGGKYVNAHTITAIGADQHDYSPTTTDVQRTQDAAVVFANGLNLEKGGSGWFYKLMKTTGKQQGKQLFNVTNGVRTIKLTSTPGGNQANPHAWNGVLEGQVYAKNIAKVLSAKDPQHKAYYAQRAQAYQKQLQAIYDKWQPKFAALPVKDHVLVTQEGAMSYFARDFNLQPYFIWEIDTEANGTPAQIKTLVDKLQPKQVTTTFVEQGEETKPMQTVNQQLGAKIAGELWTDSVSKKGGAVPTYLDLLDHNARVIYEGLKNNH
ncbi:metal ABC transporter solute-binding protein, Zn/Mn family [Weissella soli]|uniref:metal ABC transporter solute-binding protein, Zn/Mn family n=1 Tax=Weissella soli TaxID=155866 RepID=UPI00359F1348